MRQRALFLLILALSALTACSTPPRTIERPPATPTPALQTLLTPDTGQISLQLDPVFGQLVLATALGADDAPADEVTTLSANASQVYLVARVTQLPAGSRLTAVWLRDNAELGRTERTFDTAVEDPRWVALNFPPASRLTVGQYSVRLYWNDRFVDSLVFTVGRGLGASGEQATLVFAAEPPSGEGPVQAMSTFPAGTTRVVAILVNAPATLDGSWWSRWSVNGAILTELGADELQRVFVQTFTLQRDEPLPPGTYTVQVFLDSQPVAQGSFTIGGNESTPTPAMQATVEEVRIVRSIDPASGTPVGAALRQIGAPARVYVAVRVRDFGPSDELQIVWEHGGVEEGRQTVTGVEAPAEWIAVPFDVPAPEQGQAETHQVTIVLNGSPVATASLTALGG